MYYSTLLEQAILITWFYSSRGETNQVHALVPYPRAKAQALGQKAVDTVYYLTCIDCRCHSK